MLILPFELFTIRSPLTADAAAERLASVVGKETLYRTRDPRHRFEGKVEDGRFAIRRIIGYQNSFLPEIRGRIDPAPGGSHVRGTMMPHPLVLVFMLVWGGGVAWMGWNELGPLFRGGRVGFSSVFTLGMLFFAWLLTYAAFTWEALRARKLLREIFDAAPAAFSTVSEGE